MSKIQWTEETWNPIVGCSIESAGCKNCYAMSMAGRLAGMENTPQYHGTVKKVNGNTVWTGKVARASDRTLTAPMRRKKPTMYFVNSMGDLFHPNVADEWIDQVFAVMALCPQHTFQILTKHAERMRGYMANDMTAHRVARPTVDLMVANKTLTNEMADIVQTHGNIDFPDEISLKHWPLTNVWLGVSVEDQARADERIPLLLGTPAAIRFVSAEPLLGPIDWKRWLASDNYFMTKCEACGWSGSSGMQIECPTGQGDADVLCDACGHYTNCDETEALDWVICGGESGPKARPMHPDWARALRDQCVAAGVPFFFKQWGEWQPYSEHDEINGPTLYDEPPEQHPDASTRSRFDAICKDSDGTQYGLGKKGQFPKAPIGAFAGPNPMSMFRIGKAAAGRLLDGREWNEMPEVKV